MNKLRDLRRKGERKDIRHLISCCCSSMCWYLIDTLSSTEVAPVVEQSLVEVR